MRISTSSTSTTFSFQTLESFPSYEQEFLDYENLAKISYLRCDDRPITTASGLKLIYAMELNKVILLSSPPLFSEKCLLFVKETILAKLNKVLIANIDILDPVDRSNLLSSAINAQANYLLTKHQKSILRSYIRLHLRQLPSAIS
jgi:hypothetical protein